MKIHNSVETHIDNKDGCRFFLKMDGSDLTLRAEKKTKGIWASICAFICAAFNTRNSHGCSWNNPNTVSATFQQHIAQKKVPDELDIRIAEKMGLVLSSPTQSSAKTAPEPTSAEARGSSSVEADKDIASVKIEGTHFKVENPRADKKVLVVKESGEFIEYKNGEERLLEPGDKILLLTGHMASKKLAAIKGLCYSVENKDIKTHLEENNLKQVAAGNPPSTVTLLQPNQSQLQQDLYKAEFAVASNDHAAATAILEGVKKVKNEVETLASDAIIATATACSKAREAIDKTTKDNSPAEVSSTAAIVDLAEASVKEASEKVSTASKKYNEAMAALPKPLEQTVGQKTLIETEFARTTQAAAQAEMEVKETLKAFTIAKERLAIAKSFLAHANKSVEEISLEQAKKINDSSLQVNNKIAEFEAANKAQLEMNADERNPSNRSAIQVLIRVEVRADELKRSKANFDKVMGEADRVTEKAKNLRDIEAKAVGLFEANLAEATARHAEAVKAKEIAVKEKDEAENRFKEFSKITNETNKLTWITSLTLPTAAEKTTKAVADIAIADEYVAKARSAVNDKIIAKLKTISHEAARAAVEASAAATTMQPEMASNAATAAQTLATLAADFAKIAPSLEAAVKEKNTAAEQATKAAESAAKAKVAAAYEEQLRAASTVSVSAPAAMSYVPNSLLRSPSVVANAAPPSATPAPAPQLPRSQSTVNAPKPPSNSAPTTTAKKTPGLVAQPGLKNLNQVWGKRSVPAKPPATGK